MNITEKLIKRVKQLPAQQRLEVLDFVEFLHHRRAKQRTMKLPRDLHDEPEHVALGEIGVQMAALTWPKDDFSDWPGFRKSGKGKAKK